MTQDSNYFTPNNIQQDSEVAPIFIVGSGRSGTTLLRNIVNASEQIHIPYESDFIARAFPYYFSKLELDNEDYRSLVKMFVYTSQKEGWHMSEEYILKYLKNTSPQSFADVNKSIYEAYLQKEGFMNQRWGIKSPVLIANLERVSHVFPNAKIVHIVRDGRDVYLSYRNIHDKGNTSEAFGPKTILQSSLYWIDAVRRIETFNHHSEALKTHHKSIYEIRYEDILNSPSTTIRNLFDFIGIEYTDSVLKEFMQSKSNQKLLCLQSYHQQSVQDNLKGSIDSNNTEKFKKEMSRFERFIFEFLAVPYLRKYNYSIEFKFLEIFIFSPIRSMIYLCARVFNNYRYRKRDIKLIKKVDIH